MKRHLSSYGLILLLFQALVFAQSTDLLSDDNTEVWADPPGGDDKTEPAAKPQSELPKKEIPSETQAAAQAWETRIGARVDASFSAGGPVEQGFQVPSLRLWTSGMLSQLIGYKIALGPTREFSSVMLPQIIPVEAYTLVGGDLQGISGTYLRVGMFRPITNPWWSADLGSSPIPDYFLTHRAIFFSNDVGVEAAFEAIPGFAQVVLGAMNGNGIFSLNTNSTKAMTFQFKGTLPIGSAKLIFGGGAGRLLQSSEGSISFKNNWYANLFASFDSEAVKLGIDTTKAEYRDSFVSLQPTGSAAWLSVRLIEDCRAFLMIENMGPMPTQGNILFHVQAGPSFAYKKGLQVFVYYDGRVTTSTSSEREDTAQIRFRVSL